MNEFAFAAWHRSARPTIELEGTAWASQYVLLCEWGESATKFTMNVSIRTSCFRSKTPTESSCRQSRPDRSSSASRGCVYVHVPAGGSISGLLRKRATANPFTRVSCYFWSSKGNSSTTVWQRIRSVPHFLQPPAIDVEPESNAKMCLNERRDEMARTWKHILRPEHFRAKYRYVGVFFFERRFQPLSVGGFFSNQRESISRCPKIPFPSKPQNWQIARTSP